MKTIKAFQAYKLSKMDWKKENPKKRYIDSVTDEEATKLASLSIGAPQQFEITKIVRRVNGNNIPHVEIHYRYFDMILFEWIRDYMGIFHDLNIYSGKTFHSCYCQKEIFDLFNKMGFE